MVDLEVPNKYASDHEAILEFFPDDKNEAMKSVACFVANCILSFEVDHNNFFRLIEEYIQYYKEAE